MYISSPRRCWHQANQLSVGIGTAFGTPNPLPRLHRADPSTSLDDPSYSIFYWLRDIIIA